jgi:DNA-binding transcriptional MocR family regulator
MVSTTVFDNRPERPAGINWSLDRSAGATLAAQIVERIATAIEQGVLRNGEKAPSIRQVSSGAGVSFATAVAAFDKLVAGGHLEPRKGSGYYVRGRMRPVRLLPKDPALARGTSDMTWFTRSVRSESRFEYKPGSGVLPTSWYDQERLLGTPIRAIGRQQMLTLVSYGDPYGFLPLRSQLQLSLEEIGVAAAPRQILLTCGITQAIDIVTRELLQPGDAVLVDDPGWYITFGRLRALGAKLVGVPWLKDGPDVERAAQLAAEHKPRLYITNSVLQNPTGRSITAAKAHQLLQLAEQFNFLIVEDDAWGEFAAPGAVRIAALDQLKRVIYVGGFSKTVASGLRVGYIACNEELASAFVDQKMLASMTTSELGERIVHRVMTEGVLRKHMGHLRAKLDVCRDATFRRLEKVGLQIPFRPTEGLFAWADVGEDSGGVAQRAFKLGIILAPGQLFKPSMEPTGFMRFNVAACTHPAFWALLKKVTDSK